MRRQSPASDYGADDQEARICPIDGSRSNSARESSSAKWSWRAGSSSDAKVSSR